ncbi:MAG: dethiobiotin synthase [Gammaproteobacteria bacterium]|nr:dethiobiotin synthase [Gammaproteobacteria bacterium]
MPKIFIAGSDTGIGKTYISCQLLRFWNQQGLSTIGIKPLATGCDPYNEDALMLQAAASISLPYEIINPTALVPPIAPHIAAAEAGIILSARSLAKDCEPAFSVSADIQIVEGVGGWLVPLNNQETMADFVMTINAKVILVVGITLGCINHALLSYRAMQESTCEILGWIANCIDPEMLKAQENIEALKSLLPIPCLAIVGFNETLTELIF